MTGELVPDSDRLDINVDEGEEHTLVRLHGHLGIDSSPSLRDHLLAILQRRPTETIVVDLTELCIIDASGMATLLEALKVARNRQVTSCLKGLQGRMVCLFEVLEASKRCLRVAVKLAPRIELNRCQICLKTWVEAPSIISIMSEVSIFSAGPRCAAWLVPCHLWGITHCSAAELKKVRRSIGVAF